jgi:thioesterase domain-containing protein
MSPQAPVEKGPANQHLEMLPSSHTRLDEGWAEMLRAIRNVRKMQRQAPPLRPVSRQGKLPLSFAQERLWHLCQLEPGSPAYNTARAYRVAGPLSVTALAQALGEVVRRHEILRTTFPTIAGQPVQAIGPALTGRQTQGKRSILPVVDLGDLAVPDRETEAMRLVTEQVQRPFDLAQGPLLRVTLLRLGQEEYILLLVTHQMLFDGQAWGEFNREVSLLYEAFSAGKPSPLPELPIQYADFAVWQREWLQGEVLDTLLSYWKQRLDDSYSPLVLTTDRPWPGVQSFSSGRQSLTLSKTLTEALEALSQQEGATLFATLLAAFQTLLHRYSAQDDILVFSSALGRNRFQIRKLIGLFTNLLPLRTDFSGNPSFRTLLGRVRKVALGAYAHQDLPFEQLVEVLRLERGLDHASPFQVMFIFQNVPSPPQQLAGLMLIPLQVDTGMTKFNLSLSMANREDGLTGELVYKTDLFEPATIAQMLEHFRALLEGIVANPGQRVSDLLCLTEVDRQQLLPRRGGVQADCPAVGGCVLSTPVRTRSTVRPTFVAPRDTWEHQLTRIWEQILGVHPIGVRDNFFELGGHSLLAIRVFAQIENVTGTPLALATLFQAPTVEQLANVLRQEGRSSPASSLVALQSGDSRPPFFCLPGNLGNVFTDLGDLARHLGPDQTFYGLQDGVQNPVQVEAMATHYLDEIRAVQPEGPYFLGGVCSGGTVAFEMAQQLHARGQDVALLALVETPRPRVPDLSSYFDSTAYVLRHIARRLGHHSRGVPRLNFVEQWAYIRLKMKVFANIWALARYTPQPYPGRIHLFMTNKSVSSPHATGPSWSELAAGGAEVHVIPGTHDTITRTGDAVPDESHLRVLAEQLRTCIDDAWAA